MRNGRHLPRLVAAACLLAASACGVGASAAASTAPTQPSSYGVQPLAANENTGGGHWIWVLTTNQASAVTGCYNDKSGIAYYTFFPFYINAQDGSFSSNGAPSAQISNGTYQGTSAYVAGSGYANPPGPVLSNSTWSVGGSQGATYEVVYTREWVGNGVPVKEVATASSGGNASESLQVTAGAYQGSSVSVSATMSGACSGLTSAGGAKLENQTTTANAGYSQITNSLTVGGNIGNPVTALTGPTLVHVTGSYDKVQQNVGIGNATGGDSFTVQNKPDSDDTIQANITVSASGTARAGASGSGQSPGYVKFHVDTQLDFTETASG